jgi:saposin
VCDLCYTAAGIVRDAVNQGYTDDQIKEALKASCPTMPSQFVPVCEKALENIDGILVDIHAGADDKTICTKYGFCANSIKARSANDNGFACDICHSLISQIEELMVSGKTVAEIEKILDAWCQKLTGIVGQTCVKIVDTYVPQILKWLEQGLEKANICQKLGFCENSVARLPDNGFTCDMCKQVVTYVETIMKDTKVEAEVAQLVGKLCSKFPAPYDTLCVGVVNQYVPLIMQWLEQGLEKVDICSKIGLCGKELVVFGARIPAEEANGITCDVCKSFFNWAESEIEKYTVPALWKLVNEKCPNVPYLRQFCKIINEDNIQRFVDLILDQVRPEKACAWIRIC